MSTINLKVEGMTCMHCAKTVEKAVSAAGATGKVYLNEHRVETSFDESSVSLDKIKSAIEEEGYKVVGTI